MSSSEVRLEASTVKADSSTSRLRRQLLAGAVTGVPRSRDQATSAARSVSAVATGPDQRADRAAAKVAEPGPRTRTTRRSPARPRGAARRSGRGRPASRRAAVHADDDAHGARWRAGRRAPGRCSGQWRPAGRRGPAGTTTAAAPSSSAARACASIASRSRRAARGVDQAVADGVEADDAGRGDGGHGDGLQAVVAAESPGRGARAGTGGRAGGSVVGDGPRRACRGVLATELVEGVEAAARPEPLERLPGHGAGVYPDPGDGTSVTFASWSPPTSSPAAATSPTGWSGPPPAGCCARSG